MCTPKNLKEGLHLFRYVNLNDSLEIETYDARIGVAKLKCYVVRIRNIQIAEEKFIYIVVNCIFCLVICTFFGIIILQLLWTPSHLKS